MISYLKDRIKDKKVLVLGFGREGKATLKALLEAGSAQTIAIGDQKMLTLSDDAFSQPEFADFDLSGIEFRCGADYQDAIDDYDIVMKSPGIVLNRDISSYKAEIASEMQIFFEYYRDRIIGITGTKGKSTTTTLLHHILKESGMDAILAGNIGIPVFDIVHEIKDESVLVIELSCHQLEFTTVSPKWGILLNIYEEHLDHYGTMEKYIASKEKIYVNQKEGDILFVNPEVKPNDAKYQGKPILVDYATDDNAVDITMKNRKGRQPVITYHNRSIEIPVKEISLLGAHNYLDIAYVYGVCCEFGISDEDFINGLKTYVPLPHRLQYIGTVDDVAYYDDSISTIDETTIQALNTIENADTVLIGGMDREISYEKLEEYLSESSIHHIILMEATGKRIMDEINTNYPDFHGKDRLYVVDHLADAVALAKTITQKGGSCILSPAAASYGIFKNFEERGDVFAQLVLENK